MYFGKFEDTSQSIYLNNVREFCSRAILKYVHSFKFEGNATDRDTMEGTSNIVGN